MKFRSENIQYRVILISAESSENNKDMYAIYPVVVNPDTAEEFLFTEDPAQLFSSTRKDLEIEAFKLMEAFNHPVLAIDDMKWIDLETGETIT